MKRCVDGDELKGLKKKKKRNVTGMWWWSMKGKLKRREKKGRGGVRWSG